MMDLITATDAHHYFQDSMASVGTLLMCLAKQVYYRQTFKEHFPSFAMEECLIDYLDHSLTYPGSGSNYSIACQLFSNLGVHTTTAMHNTTTKVDTYNDPIQDALRENRVSIRMSKRRRKRQ